MICLSFIFMKPNIILVKGIIYHKVSTEMEPK